MTGGGSDSSETPGLLTLKIHKSDSGLSPVPHVKGRQGRSRTSSSSGMALKGAMLTPKASILFKRMQGNDVVRDTLAYLFCEM